MSARNLLSPVTLPRSHYFLTVSRGARTRTIGVRAVLAHALAATVAAAGVVGFGAAVCLLFHDELVASLLARQTRLQYAYEDRIDALRGQMQAQAARGLRDQTAVETKLRDLVSRTSRLESRSDLLASLAPQSQAGSAAPRRAASATPNPASALEALVKATSHPGGPAELPSGLAGFAPLPALAPPSKPRPEIDADDSGPPPATDQGRVSKAEVGRLPLTARLSLIGASLDEVEGSQLGALKRIESSAHDETARLNALLGDVGLSADRFRAMRPAGEGGPFVPLPEEAPDAFGLAVAEASGAVAAATRLRGAVSRLPLVSPVAGQLEVTSPFGARLDPFLGRPALHTGVDLRSDYGVPAKSTAAGRVVSAGYLGGYGNMVEVDHGDGLSTRYAHLTAILVMPGQSVAKGQTVGEVGATGRATGPHLHYEVRVDGAPVDPVRFLNAGARFASLTTQ